MPYIIIRAGPSTTENKYAFRLGFEERGASQVAIYGYQVTGLPGVGPVFVQFDGQPTTPVIGDIFSSQFPLLNATGANVSAQYNPPMLITEGDNQWNGSHLLVISLYDAAHNPVTFTSLLIILQYVPVDPHNPIREVNLVNRSKAHETVSRNVFPLPRANEMAHINSDLLTSYPYRP